jgi:hypothetical protein
MEELLDHLPCFAASCLLWWTAWTVWEAHKISERAKQLSRDLDEFFEVLEARRGRDA